VRTSPRRTPEHHGVLGVLLKPLPQHVEHVAFDPPDLLRDAVDLGIVLRARERPGVLLDGEDLVPAAGEREGDRVASGAGEGVDQYRL